MKKDNRYFLDILSRYFLLILAAFPNLAFFYFIFTPLTIYASYFFIGLLFPVFLSGNSIILNENFIISIIPACVAGAAYYLLFILNLATPNLKISKRILLILIAFFSFWIVNVLRMFFLTTIYFNSSPFFDFLHKFSWYFGSVILTSGIWFLEVYLFKIKEIPFYSDLKFLYKNSFFSKKWR
jgi:exosortase/archaeosortase family protein